MCLLEQCSSIACMQKAITHPEHLIYASKPNYCVSKLGTATQMKCCFVTTRAALAKVFTRFFNMAVKPGELGFILLFLTLTAYCTEQERRFSRAE